MAESGTHQQGDAQRAGRESERSSGAGQSPEQGRGIARRGSASPSLFSLSPRELFAASPFELMRRFSDEMDRMFGELGMTGGLGRGSGVWSPAVEVSERDGQLVVCAELPGMEKDDVRVEVTEDGIVLEGERRREHEEESGGWYRSERSYGRFHRVIPLPDEADVEHANARFTNGVLEITVPIPESRRRRRTIPIEAGGEGARASGARSPRGASRTGGGREAGGEGAARREGGGAREGGRQGGASPE